jgi:16S rRNA (guanine527-N7)-methyltransferase
MQSILADGAKQFNLSLTEAQLSLFQTYSQELIAWNQQINLTRIVEPEEIAVKHFLDSLSVCLALRPDRFDKPVRSDFSLIDVGAGAGFPGVPLKIALPHMQLTLLESTAKKTKFLHHLVETLRLSNVTIVTARAEEAGQQPAHRERYDVAVARAVTNLPVLAEYTLPLVKVGGTVVAQKGQYPAEELEQTTRALKILGGKIARVLPVNIPELVGERHLVVMSKIKATPKTYPRRPGTPAKNPL